jgi:uncharacterized protein HemY
MAIDLYDCDNNELSFLCCLTLADLAQAAGDAHRAEHYINRAYAAADRRAAMVELVGNSAERARLHA